MSTEPEQPPTEYPSAWRPRGAPVPDDELEPLAVETFLAALSPSEFQSLMTRRAPLMLTAGLYTTVADAERLIAAIRALDVIPPESLCDVLAVREALTSAPSIGDPATTLVRAALDGHNTTPEKVGRLLERAAIARLVAQERRSLNQLVDPAVIDAFHQRLQDGGADEVLDELRGGFDDAAVTIDESMQTLGALPSDPAQFVNTASAAQLGAFQRLAPAAAVLNRIAAIATTFGPRGQFPMIRNPKDRDPGLEIGWLTDVALMCCADDLRQASYTFQKPARAGDITASPWLAVRAHLNSVDEAAERLRSWVEADWTARESLRGRSGHLDENGKLVPDVRRNPHLAVTR